jgi:hypothetical protein
MQSRSPHHLALREPNQHSILRTALSFNKIAFIDFNKVKKSSIRKTAEGLLESLNRLACLQCKFGVAQAPAALRRPSRRVAASRGFFDNSGIRTSKRFGDTGA